MPSSTICISGLDGANMREIARGVAGRLGLSLVDEEIIMRAAADAGVDPGVVADAERRRSFVERALSAMTTVDASGMTGVGGIMAAPHVPEELRNLIRAAIEETAARGDAVIVAHAASHALGARSDVLRVLVTASPEVRRDRVGAERGLSEKDASKAIAESDAARADYLRRFYDTRAEAPDQYDIVVSTDKLTDDEAVALVVLASGR